MTPGHCRPTGSHRGETVHLTSMPMGPPVSAHRGHDRPGLSLMLGVRAPGRAGAAGPSRGLPEHGNDVVHAPLRTATPSGGACADRLWTLESAAVTRHLNHCGRHERRCLLVIIDGGITSLVRQCLSAGHPGGRRRPLGSPYRRRGPSPRRPPATVVWHRLAGAPTRGGGDADAGRAGPGRRKVGGRSASSRSHRASSCCRRIHSASTIAAASSSRLVAHGCGRHVIYPLPRMLRPGPAVRWAALGVDSLLLSLAIWIRRGLAFSATGMVNRSTPPP